MVSAANFRTIFSNSGSTLSGIGIADNCCKDNTVYLPCQHVKQNKVEFYSHHASNDHYQSALITPSVVWIISGVKVPN